MENSEVGKAIGPLCTTNSLKPKPACVPNITFEGFPMSVDAPPVLARITSATIMGTGSIFNNFDIRWSALLRRASP